MIDEIAQDGQTVVLVDCLAKVSVFRVIVDEMNLRVVLILIESMLRAHMETVVSHAAPVEMESKECFYFTQVGSSRRIVNTLGIG